MIGWREWLAIPSLGIRSIKAKIDSGARSSSLHAVDVCVDTTDDRETVSFTVHPRQRTHDRAIRCTADVLEYRQIRSSNGQRTRRPVIVCEIELLGQRWPIEVTLADRSDMGFRMLLGRAAFRRRFLLDAGRSYLGGRPARRRRRSAEMDHRE